MSLMLITSTNDSVNKHESDISSIIIHGDFVVSASDNGKVKVWTKELEFVNEFIAHEGYPVYDLCSSLNVDLDKNDKKTLKSPLYTCSSDATIQEWAFCEQKMEWELISVLKGHNETIRKLFYNNSTLFSGDEAGEVKQWQNGSLVSSCNFIEEVWDLKVRDKSIFTARDRDVVMNEFNENSSRWWTKKTFGGRSPIYISKNDIEGGAKICFCDRSGMDILVYGLKDDFPFLATLKGHSMIINALSGLDNFIFSGGWDQRIICWDLSNMSILSELKIESSSSITSIISDPTNKFIYVAAGQNIYSIQFSLA